MMKFKIKIYQKISSQNRFKTPINRNKIHNATWHIPITFTFKSNSPNDQLRTKWLSKARQMEIEINDLQPRSYLLVNVDRIGFYRVQYDVPNWILIANELSHGNLSISPASRAMLINDAGIFYMSGILNVRIFLELLRHLRNSVSKFSLFSSLSNICLRFL